MITKQLGSLFFRYRSYIPVPFLILMIIFMKPTFLSIIIGLFIAATGEFIRIWAVSLAGSETRTTSGVGGTYLVTQGPYGLVRNPLYIGNIMIYTGIGIMSFALFPYLQTFAFLFFLFQYYCIIIAEEDFLQNKFGNIFILYKNNVNRFLPVKRTLPPEIISQLKLNIKNGIRSERRSLQAFIITTAIITGYYIITKFSD